MEKFMKWFDNDLNKQYINNDISTILDIYKSRNIDSKNKNTRNINMSIKQIIYSGPKTIVIWADGTKTIVSCGEGDQYDRYAGFCAAIAKKIFGSTSKVKNIIDKYAKDNKNMINFKGE